VNFLVLFKSRCDNKLSEILERAVVDKQEVFPLRFSHLFCISCFMPVPVNMIVFAVSLLFDGFCFSLAC
jgi:hypothetical protein